MVRRESEIPVKKTNDLPDQVPGYFENEEQKNQEEWNMYVAGSLNEPPKALSDEKQEKRD